MCVVDRVRACISIAMLLGIPALGLGESNNDNAVADIFLIDKPVETQIDEIIVTGSRIKRSTYTSISPLQTIVTDASRQAGLIDPASILQESTPAAGFQIDLSVSDPLIVENGPGASNIDLRGLGIDRTLVLINGRRAAPAGVEGAPTAADLNLIPSLLVQQYDVLLDGASSVYGSDAVAGAVNVLLRKDFDGVELEAFVGFPQQDGGHERSIGLAWGKTYSRGLLGIGAEYLNNEPVTLSQRRWSAECEREVEIDQSGTIRTTNVYYQQRYGMQASECTRGVMAGHMWLDDLRAYVGGLDPGPGGVFYTPGATNIFIPDFSETFHGWLPGGIDGDGDGEQDVDYFDYALNPHNGDQHLWPEFERLSAMAYGEYTFTGESNLTPFFELHYNRRDVFVRYSEAQLFPWVPPDNPYNVCNPNGIDGVDCALALNDFYAQQSIIDRFVAEYGAPPQAFGVGLNPPIGGMWVRPVVRVKGDRNLADTTVEQTRLVAGVRGDLPDLDWGPLEDWSFELAAVSSRSHGTSSRPGIRDDWLTQSLETSVMDPATGSMVCGLDSNGDGIPDGVNADGRSCVPVNMWAPSLYEGIVGDFATQAERNYVFDSRDFDTRYDQWFVTGLMRGDLFQMHAGPVAAAFGFEYRQDEIKSLPDEVARDGLLFGYFRDAGAVGRKYTRELFGEIEMPLLANVTVAQDLRLNVSGRYTEDQYFGSDTTYAAKVGWRPVDSLLLRATNGTSFRAPNVRENFLNALTGPYWVIDRCAIPEEAIGPNGAYVSELDSREPLVLQNCFDNGVDPTALDFGGRNVYQSSAVSSGSTELIPETSKSYSYGFVWEQPFFQNFDLSVGWTYYEVEVRDSIIEPTAQFIIDDCYGAINLNSVLCPRITRDPATGRIVLVSAEFINRDRLVVSGNDVNIHYGQEVTLFRQPLDLAADLVLNHPTEASETFVGDEGDVDYEDRAGQWGYADWRGAATFRADIRDYRFSWTTRFISNVDQDPAAIDEWDDTTGIAHTCLGPAQGDVLCRDVGFADDYFVHSASLYYYGDTWTIGGGVRNVFDEPPPLVDGSESIDSVRNMALGYGYDLDGRTFFFNMAARFE